jgi:GMP synthase (glutamine-hydrolysing)
LTHVAFEDLDSLQPVLEQRGFSVRLVDATNTPLPADLIESANLLVVLGGPISVYEQDYYPFLVPELELIHKRLAHRRPTLGICLGAQLIAAALGARVYPGTAGSEIGWSPLLPGLGPVPAWFRPILQDAVQVLHWHGDTFDLPVGATHLASSELYQNQAFALEDFALGLQFHLEATAGGLERWYVGHTCELRKKQIDIQALRSVGRRQAPVLAPAARAFWNGWLDYIL